MMKNIQESLEAIKVNLAENQKPRKIVPTSRANVSKMRRGTSLCQRMQLASLEKDLVRQEEIYYTIPKEEEDEVVAPVF